MSAQLLELRTLSAPNSSSSMASTRSALRCVKPRRCAASWATSRVLHPGSPETVTTAILCAHDSVKTMKLTRRSLLEAAPLWTVSQKTLAAAREFSCDLAIIGGGTGGCAAALAACRNGLRVVMTEETSWIGGQLTSQAVPPDEHPWIESFGGTAAYRAYRAAVRQYYRDNYPLTAEARGQTRFNPGGGSVSALTHEPKVSLAVLEAMLARYVSAGKLIVLHHHKPIAADVQGDRVRSVTVESARTSARRTINSPWFIDATETGELLPLAKIEFVTGFESKKQTGELHAPETAQPDNHQAFTVCFALGHAAGEDHTIDKPAEYAFWRDYIPKMTPALAGQAAGLGDERPDHAQGAQGHVRPHLRHEPARSIEPLDLPPHRAGRQPRTGRGRRRRHAGQLAAERLLARQSLRQFAEGSSRAPGARQTTEPVARVLDADGSASPGRRAGVEGAAPAPRHHRHRGRAGQVPLHPRIAAHTGRVHRSGGTRRHGRADEGHRQDSRGSDGRSTSPIRSESAATASTCTRRRAATTTSTSVPCPSRFRWVR